MFKKIIFCTVCLICVCGLQSKAQQAVVSAGASYITIGFSLDVSIGQTCTFTYANSGNLLEIGVLSLQNGTVSVINAMEREAVAFYPNPANNQLHLQSHKNEDFTLTFYSIDGKLLAQQQLGVDEKSFDVSHLSSGIYLLHLTNAKGTIQHAQKLLIQH